VARGRMISASICQSIKFAELTSDTYRMMFVMILTITDREGRCTANPRILRGTCFTMLDEMTVKTISEGLKDLERVGLIELWDFNGEAVLEVVNFDKHQKIHPKEAPTKYPRLTQGEPKVHPKSTQGEPIPPKVNRIEVNRIELELEVNEIKEEVKYSVNDDEMLDALILESSAETPASDLSASSEEISQESKTPVNELDEISHESPLNDARASKTLESILLGLKPSEPQTNAAKSPHSNEESFRAAGNLRKVLEAQLSAVFGRNKDKILSEHRRKTLWFADPDKSLQTITQARHIAKDGTGNMQTLTVNMLDDACKEFAKDDLVKPSSSFVRQRQQEQYEQDQQESFVDFAAMTEKEFEAHVSKFTPAYQGFARTARERLLRTQDKDRQLEHGAVLKKQELVKQAERLYS
jgi:hypothetical protein